MSSSNTPVSVSSKLGLNQRVWVALPIGLFLSAASASMGLGELQQGSLEVVWLGGGNSRGRSHHFRYIVSSFLITPLLTPFHSRLIREALKNIDA